MHCSIGVRRRAGQARTPDALLSIPIGVEDEAGTPHVVHWIDSKAMFADLATHEDNNEQVGLVCGQERTLMRLGCVV